MYRSYWTQTGQPLVRLNGDCISTDYGIVQFRLAITVASAPLQYDVVAHQLSAQYIIIVQLVNGAPIAGAVQFTTMFDPTFVVLGVPGADGITMIVIVAPEPMLDGFEVP